MTQTPDYHALLSVRLEHPAAERLSVPDFRRAAVLVPLLLAPSGLELLFTVRAAKLANHAGQVAFPGGGLEPGESVWSAALREAREEVGLEVPDDTMVGTLSDLLSPARYVATPVVALVPWPQPLRLNHQEVAEAFTVPLAELQALTPRTEERQLRGVRRTLYHYPWRDRLIWGFTGNIVKELLDRLEEVPLGPAACGTGQRKAHP